MKKSFKTVGYALGLLLFLLIVVAGFTQSKLFKDRLRIFLVSAITANSNASLSLGTIRGNFLTGFTVDSLSLRVGKEHIVSTDEIEITYDLLSLARKTISIHRLTIHHPRITLHRGQDSVWNVNRLGKPSTPGEPSPFDWTIQTGDLKIVNGTAVVTDSISLSAPDHPKHFPHQVEYHDISVFDLNLRCRGKYSGKNAELSIKNLSFKSEQPQFHLRRFQGDFSITPRGAEVKALTLETSESHLKLTAALRDINLFDGINLEQLQHKSTRVRLLAEKIDLNELKSFIAPIDFLNGSASINLEAAGEFGNLSINRLDVSTYNTSIKLSGDIQNLHNPRNLFITADIQDSRITLSDAHILLPPFRIPRFEGSGTLPVNCRFVGTPRNFTSYASISGELGNLHVEAKLNLEKEKMEYDCTFQSQNFQIGKLFNAAGLKSFLVTQGTIKGSGTSFREMNATAKISLDSTILQSMTLTGSEIMIAVQNQRLHADAQFHSGITKVNFVGNTNFSNAQQTSFEVKTDVANLDLSKLISDNHYKSNLSLHANASGAASTLDDFTGNMKLSFSPSSFQSHEFADVEVRLDFDQRNPKEKEITLTSPVADVSLTGAFSLNNVIDRLEVEYQKMAQAIRERAASLEGTSFSSDGLKRTFPNWRNSSPSSFDLQYSCTVKNLKPLSMLTGATPFDGRGSLQGALVSTESEFSLSCSTKVKDIFVGSIEKGALFEDGSFIIQSTSSPIRQHSQSRQADYIENLSLSIDADARFGILNTHTFENTAIKISHQGTMSRYELRSTVDSLFSFITQGRTAVSQQAYDFLLDTLTLFFGSLQWNNDGNVGILVDRTGIHVTQADLKKGNDRMTFPSEGVLRRSSDFAELWRESIGPSGGEHVSLRGTLQHDGVIDADLAIRQFNLAYVGNYFGLEELALEQSFSGNLNLDVSVSGTLTAPRILLETSCSDLAYRSKTIGVLTGLLNYENQNLKTEIKIDNKEETLSSDLVLSGDVPIDLAMGSVEKRFPEKPMNVVLTSNGFELGLFDPLIASLDHLQGKLWCTINVGGTPGQPSYAGSITLSSVRFLFAPNNLLYNLNGKLEAAGDKINIIDLSIANNPGDRRDGAASIVGSFTIRNFTIGSFDLTANGQLLLIQEASRKTLKTIYGTLFAAIGPNGLKFRGSFDQSSLNGTVYIKDANLIFPPTSVNSSSNRETALTYRVIDDTSTDEDAKQKFLQQFYGGNSAPSPNDGISFGTEQTIWDGMEYDVEIETHGTTDIRMIFNQATNEELFAGLDGKVVLQNRKAHGAQLIGEIAVAERSYYSFFKRFSAGGALKFVGLPDNPELNIKAQYEGTRNPPEGSTDSVQQVVVMLDITGTRYEPKLTMSMTVDGVEWTSEATGSDVQSDAISFILTGKFRDDLTSREESDIASSLSSSASSSLLYGLPSQLLSGVLSDFLRNEVGFIRSAELTYTGGNLQESADLRLSGEVGRAYWRFGGKIFNNIGNANVSFQLSMGEVFSVPKLRDFFIELERKVEGTDYVDQKKLTNAARIFYKFSF